MKKKIRKFIQSKGGFWALLGFIATLLLAAFLIIVGVIYADYGGNWSKIPQVLSCDTAITVYVVFGLLILALIYLYVIIKRKEDIR